MSLLKENSYHHISIKNMVCDRCISTVEDTLAALGAGQMTVTLGEAAYENELALSAIKTALDQQGFELIEAPEDILVEEMKLFMQAMLNTLPLEMKSKLSELISEHFTTNYERLSKLFSQHEKVTIERYFLLLKIEKAKELIQYGRLNFTEIAFQLDYASINHLSKQFKAHLGMSLSDYKKQNNKRKPIDKII